MTGEPLLPAASVSTAARCRVVVCRGCCCGTERKLPEVDHEAQLLQLRDAEGDELGVRVVTDCLGPCAEANVLVVQPSKAGRRAGGRPQWIGRVCDARAVDALLDWVRSGGPGITEMPESVRCHAIPTPEPKRTKSKRAVPKPRSGKRE